MMFKLQKPNKKFSTSLCQIYRTDTGHEFSLQFAYELLIILEIYIYINESVCVCEIQNSAMTYRQSETYLPQMRAVCL